MDFTTPCPSLTSKVPVRVSKQGDESPALPLACLALSPRQPNKQNASNWEFLHTFDTSRLSQFAREKSAVKSYFSINCAVDRNRMKVS